MTCVGSSTAKIGPGFDGKQFEIKRILGERNGRETQDWNQRCG